MQFTVDVRELYLWKRQFSSTICVSSSNITHQMSTVRGDGGSKVSFLEKKRQCGTAVGKGLIKSSSGWVRDHLRCETELMNSECSPQIPARSQVLLMLQKTHSHLFTLIQKTYSRHTHSLALFLVCAPVAESTNTPTHTPKHTHQHNKGFLQPCCGQALFLVSMPPPPLFLAPILPACFTSVWPFDYTTSACLPPFPPPPYCTACLLALAPSPGQRPSNAIPDRRGHQNTLAPFLPLRSVEKALVETQHLYFCLSL